MLVNMKTTQRFLIYLLIGLLTVWLAFWATNYLTNKTLGDRNNSEKPVIAATIFPLYDLVKQVVGDQVEVVLLVPPGANEHTFELSPNTVASLSQADLVFTIGQGLDDWVAREAAQAGRAKVVAVSEGVNLLTDDPHYWLSLKESKKIVANIAKELAALYPDQKVIIEHNAALYDAALEKTIADYQQEFTGQPNLKIATFHNAFSYLARDFNIEIVTTFEEVSGEQPSIEWLKDFQTKVKQFSLKTVYAEPQSSPQSLEAIAQDLGVKIGTLDPVGGVDGRDSYLKLMKYNLDTILAK